MVNLQLQIAVVGLRQLEQQIAFAQRRAQVFLELAFDHHTVLRRRHLGIGQLMANQGQPRGRLVAPGHGDLHLSELAQRLGLFGLAAITQHIGLRHRLLEHQLARVELHQHLPGLDLVAHVDMDLAQITVKRRRHEQQVLAAQR